MVRHLAGIGFVTLLVVGCASGDSQSIESALVGSEDLPGTWEYFEPRNSSGRNIDNCGQPRERPTPTSSAATGWAVTPDDGPIFGERIEQFTSSADVASLINHPLDTPCEFERDDGSRWRTEEQEPFGFGDYSRVQLITSLDTSDSFNYEVAIASDDVALLAVLNSRNPDRELLEELITIAWSKAVDEGLVG